MPRINCPHCQKALNAPTPTPARLRCPQCGQAFPTARDNSKASPVVAAPPTIPAEPTFDAAYSELFTKHLPEDTSQELSLEELSPSDAPEVAKELGSARASCFFGISRYAKWFFGGWTALALGSVFYFGLMQLLSRTEYEHLSWFFGGFFAVIGMALLLMTAIGAVRRPPATLWILDSGIAWRRRSRNGKLLWKDFHVKRGLVKHESRRANLLSNKKIDSGSTFSYEILGEAGEYLKFTTHEYGAKVKPFGEWIVREVTRARFADAWRECAAGGTLAFGPFTLSREELSFRGESRTWSELSMLAIQFDHETFAGSYLKGAVGAALTRTEDRLSTEIFAVHDREVDWAKLPVSDVPNPWVFFMLANEILKRTPGRKVEDAEEPFKFR